MSSLKEFIIKNKVLNATITPIYHFLVRDKNFRSSEYWEKRYQKGGNSGAGSYGRLSEFKAKVINGFAAEHNVRSVIEFGCGDGNQLGLFKIPHYTGLDVSSKSVQTCIGLYGHDDSKSFFKYEPACFRDTLRILHADATMSLDVVYHLIEDEVYEKYMTDLFGCADRYVIIYASNTDEQTRYQAQHVKHRKFTDWVEANQPSWSLKQVIENEYTLKDNSIQESFAHFFIFEKQAE